MQGYTLKKDLSRQFLEAWFEGCGGIISIGGIGGPFQFVHVGNIGLALDECIRNQKEPLYYRLCPMEGKPSHGRGLAKDTFEVPGLWLDIDIGKRDCYFQTVEEANAWLSDYLGHWIFAIVESGTGLHPYFKFTEPFVCYSESDYEEIKSLAYRFNIWADSMCPKTIDNTGDLARVLKLPGQRLADGTCIYPAWFSLSTTVDMDEIQDYVGCVDKAHVKRITPAPPPGPLSDELVGKIVAAKKKHPSFERILNRQYHYIQDKSDSGWCWAIACKMHAMGFTAQETTTMLREWRSSNGCSAKPESWYALTVGKIFSENEPLAQEEFDMDIVNKTIGAELVKIERHVPPAKYGDRGDITYSLHFDGIETSINVTSEILLSPKRLAAAMLDELQIVSPIMTFAKKKTEEIWYPMVQKIINAAEDVEDNDSKTRTIHVEKMLKDFIGTMSKTTRVNEEISGISYAHPICKDGEWCYFHEGAFISYAFDRYKEKGTAAELEATLAQIGCTSLTHEGVRILKSALM